MTFWDKLGDGPLMQGTSNQQDYVVNHVTVPTEGRKLQILINPSKVHYENLPMQ